MTERRPDPSTETVGPLSDIPAPPPHPMEGGALGDGATDQPTTEDDPGVATATLEAPDDQAAPGEQNGAALIDHTVPAPPDESLAPRKEPKGALARELERQRDRLAPCVHCGFCLPACPTYRRLGDEADSPRGRLHLMDAVAHGRLDPASEAFATHIDRCLGCRACEPVCPSGVEYGTLLELARDVSARSRSRPFLERALLAVFASPFVRDVFFALGRFLRKFRLAALGRRLMPGVGPLAKARVGLAMLDASRPWKDLERTPVPGRLSRMRPPHPDDDEARAPRPAPAYVPDAPPERGSRGTIGVLLGCVQTGLYDRVNDATVRALQINGFNVVPARGQDCCGALHAHGGNLDRARALARKNIRAFLDAEVEYVVVNAAGCGAVMKEYEELFADDERWRAKAAELASRVRDVTEILAEVGPHQGAAVPCAVAYDHPCHLLHAQRIADAPIRVLTSIPSVEVRVVRNADECCGGAGIYGLTHPDLGGAIAADKVAAVRREGCDVAATPNPGCMMQIGAGLRMEGASEWAVHPVELLDESYRRAGFYLKDVPPGTRRG